MTPWIKRQEEVSYAIRLDERQGTCTFIAVGFVQANDKSMTRAVGTFRKMCQDRDKEMREGTLQQDRHALNAGDTVFMDFHEGDITYHMLRMNENGTTIQSQPYVKPLPRWPVMAVTVGMYSSDDHIKITLV